MANMTPPTDHGSGRMPSVASMGPPKVRSRTHSLSSDRASTIGAGFMSPPLTVSPEAAFIAAAAASQIVTNDHDAHQDIWYDQQGIEPPSETVLVSPAALALINNFLDRLLFNLLSTAKSTSLAALRPAVSEVLKPKLAKDAIYQADEELQEYLGGGEDEDYGSPARSQSARDWDLELVWKRTRLRCMVYSSLGDLEEEDEDFHMEQENLLTGDETVEETISPAVAIFLTSVLEFMGEQALIVAGQAAFQRMRHHYEKSLREGTRSPADVADRIVVGDSDVERIALDRTLGRLWRSWKKQMRSPALSQDATFRNFSRDSARSSSMSHYRFRSLSVDPPRRRNDGSASPLEVDEEPELDRRSTDGKKPADCIPLPVGPDDMLEILIPGLAHYSDDEEEIEDAKSNLPRRPKSMLLSPLAAGVRDPPTPAASVPCTPKFPPRRRANSLPTPAASPFSSPMNKHVEAVASPTEVGGVVHNESVTSNLESENLSGGDNEASASKVPPVSQKSSYAVTESRTDKEVQRPTLQQRRMSSAQIAAMIAGSSGSKSPGLPARSPGLPAISPGLPAAPEQELHDEAEEIEEFCEEPEILTTSRISVSGRSTSPTTSERSKPAITIGIPKRSASVHSVRVIEVATPRSPMSRSRNSSADAQERTSMRTSNLSRTDSTNSFTPPIREEGARQTSPSRKAYPFPTKSTRLHQSDSISEAEESTGSPVPSMSVSTLSSRTPTPLSEQKPATSYDDLEAQVQSQPQTIFTVPRDSDSSVRNSPATKVTIVSSSSSSGSFYHEDKPHVARNSRSAAQAKADVPPPPERSANRPQGTSTPSTRQASSATTVSAERSSPNRRAPSQTREAVEPPRERERSITPMSMEKGSSRKHHDSVSTVSSLQQRLKPVRASQDSTRPVDIKTFDELIQSDETIQYTLTPESMRDIDSIRSGKNDSPVLRPKSRKGDETKFQEHSRSASTPTGGPRASDLKRSASVSRAGALSSHPINEGAPLSGPIPRAPGLTPSKSHGAGPQARDARIPLESLTEFADFIRATGPPGASGGIGASFRAPASGPARSTAGPAAGPKQSLESSGRVSNTSNRARYQARDAATDPREDNSDLIDFIRRGPQTKDNPRIPRTVAPFRNTMDSDQFATASGGKAVDATLPDIRHSAASTSVTENSVPSSINSQSALLRKDKSMAGARGGQGNANMFDEEDMIPKRKQRRVRDPYAIDFSDEEDDEFEEATPKPSRRLQPPVEKEETLAEFLMNVPPPKETSPVPFNLPSQNPPTPKKKSSTASLMARFTRRDSTRGDRNKADKESNKLTKQPDPNSVAPQSRAGGGRGYVPIQVNLPSGVNDYGSIPPRPKTTGSSGRVPMRKFEPREAVPVPNRAISELADFLRNSEPPRNFGPAAYGGENTQRLPKQFVESGQRLPKQFAQR
ncbi:hypothetical protein MGG_09259 [Pyricularia oryzae 70-15]|uniref:Flo11 n=3 Tax=Pyricularia oryzae TaxID=318829 RepID=G4MQ86_PYRO7|nr:uncharacterized protein MGG_09259 [Pyricularia oryzae 70-15]EHA57279.1 hypothetical protein MGG_09259 [Pyricularia oryzae 70-15]ELQ41320.1 hypothetical protein OOU_Y34scaffold00283g13 [Pyricularia oryzae Y34]KAI7923092.1 hypothetical protein M0657_005270 [Pyricularia oryzae]KAI7926012.1 hypothetical protein M9X92_002968 [Pyricularia oryzae]